MIELRNVSYSYPESPSAALKDVNLQVGEGEFLLVAGPSGSGKSTLLRGLNGLVPHFSGGRISGDIRVAGRDPVKEGPHHMSTVVGFVQQDPEAQFVVDTVEDELAFAMENHGRSPTLMRKRVEEVLDQLNIAHLRHRQISSLSGGEKQLVAIGSVLTLHPEVLVLDEPTSQLDPQAAEEVLNILRQLNSDLGLTILLSEHRLERVAQYADRLVYLPEVGGEQIVGTPGEVLRQMPVVPPLIELARALDWTPIPLTIREARRRAAELRFTPRAPERVSDRSPACVEVRDVWYNYNGTEALRGLDFVARPGELIAIMGRNGSGKTTLLKHLIGLLQPRRGEVTINGLNTRDVQVEDLIGQVGYVPQNPEALLFSDTVRKELEFTLGAQHLPLENAQKWLEMTGLQGLEERYPRDLSVGEKQRVAIAAILVAEPSILLLDEPTRGLDLEQKRSLADFLRAQAAQGRTVLIVTHDVELVAECAQRVVILGEGQVVVDGPAHEVMGESMVFASQMNKLFRDPHLLTVRDVLAAVEHNEQ